MTTFEAPRGLVRAALQSVLPHAGRETDETPALGRVRLVATPEAVLVWATDHRTSALARIERPDFDEPELPSWDMPVDAVKKVLQVFRGPTDADARQMWSDQPMAIEVTDGQVTFTEVGSIIDGQSLTVARIVGAGDDRYPDVPRELATLSAAVIEQPTFTAFVNVELLARFTVAAKAHSGGSTPLATLRPGHGLHRALLRIGHAFLGSMPAYPDGQDYDALAVAQTQHHEWWSDVLTPHMRALPVRVPTEVVDDLRAQAEEIFRTSTPTQDGPKVTLHVVRDGAPR